MGHRLRLSLSSSTWDERCCPPMTIFRRYNITYGGCGKSGGNGKDLGEGGIG